MQPGDRAAAEGQDAGGGPPVRRRASTPEPRQAPACGANAKTPPSGVGNDGEVRGSSAGKGGDAIHLQVQKPDLPEGKEDADKKKPSELAREDTGDEKEVRGSAVELAVCFAGLQASYLTWGYLQEKVMTTEYSTGMFPSAAFCVFSNRVLAIVIAAAVLVYRKRRLHMPAPFTAFAPCSLSNSLSSYAQYQALRYVSFQLQTLSKSIKVIPVLLVGRILNKKSYSMVQYAEAFAISFGVSIFMLSEKTGKKTESMETQLQGVFMLALYLVSDSFTSQWQSRVYKDHPQVDQFHMMFATNTWSMLLTLAALLASGELLVTLAFLVENPAAIVDNVAIAFSSAIGQLFIFRTIWKFGPVVFTLIMTTRQMFSMVLSAIAFGHTLSSISCFGAAIVFLTLLLQSRRRASGR